MAARFVDVSDWEIDQFKENSVPQKTKDATKFGVKLFKAKASCCTANPHCPLTAKASCCTANLHCPLIELLEANAVLFLMKIAPAGLPVVSHTDILTRRVFLSFSPGPARSKEPRLTSSSPPTKNDASYTTSPNAIN
ncbi:unnamed protein product, partial [Porites evermanni]